MRRIILLAAPVCVALAGAAVYRRHNPTQLFDDTRAALEAAGFKLYDDDSDLDENCAVYTRGGERYEVSRSLFRVSVTAPQDAINWKMGQAVGLHSADIPQGVKITPFINKLAATAYAGDGDTIEG